jgi:hypothetical protein
MDRELSTRIRINGTGWVLTRIREQYYTLHGRGAFSPPPPRPRYFRNPPGRYVRALRGVLLCLVETKEVQRRVDPGDEAGNPTLDAALPGRASQVRTWNDYHSSLPGSQSTSLRYNSKKDVWTRMKYFFLRASVWWPIRCLCRLLCIFERCLDSNHRAALASRCATNLATHLATNFATHLPKLFFF